MARLFLDNSITIIFAILMIALAVTNARRQMKQRGLNFMGLLESYVDDLQSLLQVFLIKVVTSALTTVAISMILYYTIWATGVFQIILATSYIFPWFKRFVKNLVE